MFDFSAAAATRGNSSSGRHVLAKISTDLQYSSVFSRVGKRFSDVLSRRGSVVSLSLTFTNPPGDKKKRKKAEVVNLSGPSDSPFWAGAVSGCGRVRCTNHYRIAGSQYSGVSGELLDNKWLMRTRLGYSCSRVCSF